MNPGIDSTAFVTCTMGDAGSFASTPLGLSLAKIPDAKCKVFSDNRDGLSKCYNLGIEWAIANGFKRLVFAHDDLWIVDAFLFEKLEKAFLLFDIVGVAGAASFSISHGLDGPHKKIAWHICAPREHWTGAVEHPHMDHKTGKPSKVMTYMSYFGPTPRLCATIDGLFMAVNMETIGDVRFDENFKFDFYDLTFCCRANKASLKVGTTNIHVMHESHGTGIMNQTYSDAQELFLKLYRK